MRDLLRDMTSVVLEARAADLLERLIGYRSVNPPGNEAEIAEFIAGMLRSWGLSVELTEVEPNRPNVVGVLEMATPGPTLLLNSHMDVVPEGEGWQTDPFTAVEREGVIYGRGAVDAKGPLATMLAAVEVLAQFREFLTGRVVMAAVADEEAGSRGTRKLVRDVKADMAIVGEPTEGRICVAHKGTCRATLSVRGKSAHAAEPDSGINAIEGAARLIEALGEYHRKLREKVHPLLGSPTAVVTTINGGTKGNMVPDRCKMTLSRRMIPGESEEMVARELREIFDRLKRSDTSFEARIENFAQTSGGPSETPGDHPFVQRACQAIGRLLHSQVSLYGFTPNCDMAQLRGVAGIPTIILGPGETKVSHQANEHVERPQLRLVGQMYVAIACETLRRPGSVATASRG